MQSYTFSVCRQCRLAVSRGFHTSLPAARTGTSTRPPKSPLIPPRAAHAPSHRPNALYGPPRSPSMPPRAPHPPLRPSHTPRTPNPAWKRRAKALNPLSTPKKLSPEAIRLMLLRNIAPWRSAAATLKRLTTLGLETPEAETLLAAYEAHIREEITVRMDASYREDRDPWGIAHLLADGTTNNDRAIIDRALTMRLFAFAAQPALHVPGVRPESLHVLAQAREALDLRFPAEVFTMARCRRRKVYLHVGPTNSGKTYNALRALAAARSGVYAGPLRLLAHEVWERLNRGSIRPHDAPPSSAHLYARPCNLITGEEQRIVSPEAPLASCTVEMVNIFHHYSVCVIDEIQMIADAQRGNAWTAAVLGVCADEVHLCGEEAAVPLVEALMRETGDELVVKHYERLTPLAVAEKSLEGRWDRIERGDCVVTFSRTSIFALKRLVEQATGLRCAVAYGRLPPETRSEQAALFNDPDSGYDVMVASDAIGMGLNLKIKRVVFVQLTKYNGVQDVSLSLSQIKQIGGRAGRFGERGDASSTGIVTCLNENDLPILAKAFAMEPPVLRRAIVPLHLNVLSKIAQLLPVSFGITALHALLHDAASLGDNYSLPQKSSGIKGMEVIDRYGKDLRLVEKMQFAVSPTSWRTDTEVEVFGHYLRQFAKGGTVDLRECLKESGLLYTLESVTNTRKLHEEAQSTRELGAATGYEVQTTVTLATLETLHKVVVNYIWLGFRMPVSFSQHEDAVALKEETEKGIEFVLEGIENVQVRDLNAQLRREVKTLQELRDSKKDEKIEYTNRMVKAKRAKLA